MKIYECKNYKDAKVNEGHIRLFLCLKNHLFLRYIACLMPNLLKLFNNVNIIKPYSFMTNY